MPNFIDLQGQRFGRLVALERIDIFRENGRLRTCWKCICDCGQEKTIRADHLRDGSIVDCRQCPSEDFRELIEYDPITGLFHWYIQKGNRASGWFAGCPYGEYLAISHDNQNTMTHRLAWYLMTGSWPINDIDHKNHNKRDNRWLNLRSATRQQNSFNRLANKNSITGVRGVTIVRNSKGIQYNVRLGSNKQRINLGNFHTLEEAAEAWRSAAQTIYGEFVPETKENQ
jgi:hypothetical protein